MYQSLSKRGLFGRLISASAVYGLSLGLTRAGWIFLLPIYWTRLGPAEYGVIALAQMLQVFLTPILSLGLAQAVQRFYFEWKPEERKRHIGGLWLLTQAWSFAICGTLLLAGPALSPYVAEQVSFYPYLALGIATAFFGNFMHFPLAILRSQERAKTFAVLSIASFVLQAACTILLVVVYEGGVVGYLVGGAANAAVWAFVSVALVAREVRYDFRGSHVREPLRYALPTVPLALMDAVGSVADRYFLDKHTTLPRIGLYNLGNQIAGAYNLFGQTMKMSWVPFIYRLVAERRDAPAVLAEFSVYYVALLSVPALAVALLAKELIVVIGDERFYGVYEFVPGFVLIYYLSVIANALGRGLELSKKTSMWPIVAAVSLAVMLLALALLVPRWGPAGALAGLVIAAIARIGTQVALSQAYYPMPLHMPRLLAVWVIVAATFAAGYLLPWPTLVVAVLGKCALIIAAGVAMCRAVLGRNWSGKLRGLFRAGAPAA